MASDADLQTADPTTWAQATWNKGLEILGDYVKNATAKTPAPAPTPAANGLSLNTKTVLLIVAGVIALVFVLKKL